MFDSSLIKAIIDAWQFDQNQDGHGRQKMPPPSESDIHTVVTTVFYASLKREEEQPIKLQVTVLEEKDKSNQIVLKFNNYIDFNVESLVKLAPAFDPNSTSFLICKDNENGFKIWGVAFFGGYSLGFTEIAATVLQFGDLMPPDSFTVSATRPGSFVVSRRHSIIGRFDSGQFSMATQTVFHSRSMGQHFLKKLESHEGFKKYKNSYWIYYHDSIEQILKEAVSAGHGGTIVFLDDKYNYSTNDILCRYKLTSGFDIESDLLKLCEFAKLQEPLFEAAGRKELVARLKLISKMTCIDGALIMTDRLKVISFGSFLTGSEGPDHVRRGQVYISNPGEIPGEVLDVSGFGTRHASAVKFVGRNPGSIAFVISQDGVVRGLFGQDKNTVFYWPDCLSSMSID